jgi:replication initiation protein RepC
MNDSHPTTPFGRRTLTVAMMAAQAAAKACPEDRVVHKWKLFRSITDAREKLEVSDRALTVLNALLTCLPETALTPGSLIVFPSNASLSERTHGMAGTTLRRHLFALVESGLIVRRDSPNGKRYVRRGRDGNIEHAFGFDLTPIVARAEEIERLADEVRTERRMISLARERVTILRRDIGKMLAIAEEEGASGDWASLRRRFAGLGGRLPRGATLGLLEPLADDLERLAAEMGKLLDIHLSAMKTDGNDSHSGAHYQSSNPDASIELEPASQESRVASVGENKPAPEERGRPPTGFPLGLVLKACPDVGMYSRSGISSWSEFVATAGLVRGALGVSPSAWEDAVDAMGEVDAAVTIAAILQRAAEIKSPGGYLRDLTAKARAGDYSIGPQIMALWKRQKTGAGEGARSG